MHANQFSPLKTVALTRPPDRYRSPADNTKKRQPNYRENTNYPMRNIITTILEDSIRTKRQAVMEQMDTLIAAADMLVTCVASGHKILLFGNGGSAADAQHLAAEFVNRFQIERHPLPALALTTDTSIITSIGNDYSFDQIFEKQIQALRETGRCRLGHQHQR